MAEIEIRPDDARAAMARLAAVAEAVDHDAAVFRSTGEELASSVRHAPIGWALTELVQGLAPAPCDAALRFRELARTGADAVDGMVAVDEDGARMMAAIPAPGVAT
ncbi:hypothetical protein ACFRFH_03120 [Leifsonia sp. NPDC056824]|uniref:hypothetical protein n=1 Tax=Leifsonia sp. NPDC056824 TaxID=3345953 RepID=UPI0036A2017C